MRSASRRILWIALALVLIAASVLLFMRQQGEKGPPGVTELSETERQTVRRVQNTQAKESSRASFLDDLQGQVATCAEERSCAVVWREDADLPESAAAVLKAYQTQGSSRLMCSGYMDLKGNVWGGIVMSGAWVDIIYVTSIEDGEASTVRIVRLLAEDTG